MTAIGWCGCVREHASGNWGRTDLNATSAAPSGGRDPFRGPPACGRRLLLGPVTARATSAALMRSTAFVPRSSYWPSRRPSTRTLCSSGCSSSSTTPRLVGVRPKQPGQLIVQVPVRRRRHVLGALPDLVVDVLAEPLAALYEKLDLGSSVSHLVGAVAAFTSYFPMSFSSTSHVTACRRRLAAQGGTRLVA